MCMPCREQRHDTCAYPVSCTCQHHMKPDSDAYWEILQRQLNRKAILASIDNEGSTHAAD